MSTTTKSPSKAKTTKSTTKSTGTSAKLTDAKPKATQASAPGATMPTETHTPISAPGGKTPSLQNAPAATVVDGPQAVILGPVLRKKELIETVVTRSGVKKKDAKPVVDAMLAVLGDALADNRDLILPPLGRIKIRREKKLPNGRVLTVKIRQTAPLTPDEET
ncbi:HU family DNA-binding protein [Sulfitobacter sp. MF3-043]|uniref:HU family DNA-binding protein n=1 Tax=Sulfitobacter sediminivivens TaxID=3252902 RepID=UPI0036D7ED50